MLKSKIYHYGCEGLFDRTRDLNLLLFTVQARYKITNFTLWGKIIPSISMTQLRSSHKLHLLNNINDWWVDLGNQILHWLHWTQCTILALLLGGCGFPQVLHMDWLAFLFLFPLLFRSALLTVSNKNILTYYFLFYHFTLWI